MTAPSARRVDALTGRVANEKFFAALSEADNFVRELDELHELRTRVEELTAERDDLADRLVSLRDASNATLGLLADAKREVRKLRDERDAARNDRDSMRWEVSR